MDSVQRNVKSLEGFGQTFNNLHQNQQFLSGKKKKTCKNLLVLLFLVNITPIHHNKALPNYRLPTKMSKSFFLVIEVSNK